MYRLLLLFAVFALSRCASEKPFDAQVRQLFFDAELTAENKRMVAHFGNVKELTPVSKDRTDSYTMYPSLSGVVAKGDGIVGYRFNRHPAVTFPFRYGGIELQSGEPGSPVAPNGLLLSFFFSSRVEAEKAFSDLNARFVPLATESKQSGWNGLRQAALTAKEPGEVQAIRLAVTRDEQSVNGYRLVVYPEWKQ